MEKILDPEVFQKILNDVRSALDDDGRQSLTEINQKLVKIKEMTTKIGRDYAEHDFKGACKNCPPSTFDLILYQRDSSKIKDLMIEVQSAYIKYLLRSIEGFDVLTDISSKAGDIAHELDLKIEVWTELDNKEKQDRSKKSSFAANKKHERTNLAKQKIKDIWATGKYKSRDVCAEQECAFQDISYSTARKALRNTPEPE